MKKKIYDWQKKTGIYLTLILLFSACAAAQDLSHYDLSTDEGVNRAREARLGRKLTGYSRGCIRRPAELPGIILVGTFAHDRGCMMDGAFIRNRLAPDKNAFSKPALETLGWRKASLPEREEAALRWVQFGILAFENPLDEPTEDFAGRDFAEPAAVGGDDSTVRVTLWIRHRPGMLCQKAYERLAFVFDGDGNLAERKSLESFRIPCKRN